MRKSLLAFFLAAAAIALAVSFWPSWREKSPEKNPAAENPVATPSAPVEEPPPTAMTATPQPEMKYSLPIADFESRITKKRFGTYVEPENSPVSPEKFTGYHAGVDVEYGDVEGDVPVFAVTDGTVARSGTVSGYGGLLVLRHDDQNLPFTLYGHLRQGSLPATGTRVSKGEKVGVLGTAYSAETANERRHLHFAVITGPASEVRGYVSGRDMLDDHWKNPLEMLIGN